jgi:xylulokinase
MKQFFLGLDCSTQSLSAVLIDFGTKKVVYEKQLVFEKEFSHYQTQSGALRWGNVVHSPPLMWVEALDRLFSEMQKEGVDLGSVLAVSGSAQQHGSVYLNEHFPSSLKTMRLKDAFSRPTAPIWMDASTTKECEEIRDALGGALATIEATGSNTFERFTGPQIRKFYKTEPQNYEKTQTIALVSSFLASVMSGKLAPIDHGDGSGMNLMDIRKKAWHAGALAATAPGLEHKLPPLAKSWQVVGKINPYFEKYGLNKDALSLVWTGDNPSSLIGLGLIEEGMTAVSLGTSFTHFGCLKSVHIDPKGEGHLFVSPTDDYMTLNCFLNGALAIQKMRETYGLSWEAFNAILETTPAGNHDAILLPYFNAEIIPKVLKPKLHRFDLDPKDAAANCRALIEAQMMSMRIHSDWMKLKPKQIYATGGVSHNLPILQILADVFNCEVLRSEVSKSTALGAALRAAYGYFGKKSWKEIVSGFTDPIPAVRPNPAAVKIYDHLVQKYQKCEAANK